MRSMIIPVRLQACTRGCDSKTLRSSAWELTWKYYSVFENSFRAIAETREKLLEERSCVVFLFSAVAFSDVVVHYLRSDIDDFYARLIVRETENGTCQRRQIRCKLLRKRCGISCKGSIRRFTRKPLDETVSFIRIFVLHQPDHSADLSPIM